MAASVPCRKCHPRAGRYLEEEVEYDDDEDVTVEYAVPHWKRCAGDSGGGSDIQRWECKNCKGATPNVVVDSKDDELSTAMKRTLEKVELHLVQENLSSNDTDQKEKKANNEEDQEMLEKLSCLSSSVLGSRHWCTNIILISILGRKLTMMHTAMLFHSTAAGKKGKGQSSEGVDMTELAECIDSLQRLWQFVTRLGLRSHPGHLLGSLTIGVARVLIGLGDEKSMEYGAQWATKVDGSYYQRGFEGDGMIKVVDAMVSSCKRKGERCVREREGEGEEVNAEKKKKSKCK